MHPRLSLAAWALALALVTSRCAAEPCPDTLDGGPDVGEAPDASTCRSRLVIGPVVIAASSSAFAGDGVPLTDYPPRDLRVRLFRSDGSVAVDRVMTSGSVTDYLDLGDVPPGDYSVAIEVTGTSLLVGAELVRADACPGPLAGAPWCRAPHARVAECDLVVLPVGLGCDDSTGVTCGAP